MSIIWVSEHLIAEATR